MFLRCVRVLIVLTALACQSAFFMNAQSARAAGGTPTPQPSATPFARPDSPAASAASSAPGTVVWSKDIQLSSLGMFAGAPAIAADSAGAVHAIWSEREARMKIAAEGAYFMYARFDGENWTRPVDVLTSSADDGVEAPSLAYTPDGFLHAVWSTGTRDSQLLYARAPACCADKARNWSKPIVLGLAPTQTTNVIADQKGRLHVAFASLETSDIEYMRSDDSGLTWQLRRIVQGKVRVGDENAVYPRIAVDGQGRVHMVWTLYPWPGVYALYTRSDDGGATWTEPQIIDRADSNAYVNDQYGPTYISVYATTNPQGVDRVHLIWDGAPTVERNYIYSDDGGKTWSNRYIAFSEITKAGRAGYNPLLMDSAGTLHATAFWYYSTWLGSGWSPVSTRFIDVSSAEEGASVLTMGNRLNVIWQGKYSDAGVPTTVSFAWGLTSAPTVPAKPLPEVPHDISTLQPIAYGPRPTADTSSTQIARITKPTPMAIVINPVSTPANYNPLNVALLGIVPLALVVVGIIAFRLLWTRRT